MGILITSKGWNEPIKIGDFFIKVRPSKYQGKVEICIDAPPHIKIDLLKNISKEFKEEAYESEQNL